MGCYNCSIIFYYYFHNHQVTTSKSTPLFILYFTLNGISYKIDINTETLLGKQERINNTFWFITISRKHEKILQIPEITMSAKWMRQRTILVFNLLFPDHRIEILNLITDDLLADTVHFADITMDLGWNQFVVRKLYLSDSGPDVLKETPKTHQNPNDETYPGTVIK